ncbi:MAG: selenocysteine-specific translation elongation factor [Coriobacteriales bacterium]|jgi:selenocysteine-specific elongation factor|nr:selenocysteine-specific translation elongation factor [Coriobacteriales bacterium]
MTTGTPNDRAVMTADASSPQQPAPRLILGTAGHIDHGKSSLVKALTGTDPDRLAEEKRRGITIELGFARLALPDGTVLGVVDVPGHERFVRQMIAGASGIDLALLCIAADDGVMPQTLEHIAVLEVLGITRCVVALTKSDLVDGPWLAYVGEEVAASLSTTPLKDAPVVAVSSKSEEGLDELKRLLGAAARAAAANSARHAQQVRYPVDRVFSVKGSGTVTTGTLWSGEVRPDMELEVLRAQGTAARAKARVRSVQVHGVTTDCAQAGSRVALNLGGLKTSEVRPGDFLAAPGLIIPTDRFDARVTYLDTAQSARALESGSRVHVCHGTKEVVGRLLLMDGRKQLEPQESCFAQVRLEEPLPVSWQDRFVLRSYSPVRVAGGGTVLAAHPRRRTMLVPGEKELLEALTAADAPRALRQAFALARVPVTASELARVVGVGAPEALCVLQELVSTGAAVVLGHKSASAGVEAHYCSRPIAQKSCAAIENTLLGLYADDPALPGVTRQALRQLCEKRGLPRMGDAAFEALVAYASELGQASVGPAGVAHPRAEAGARQIEAEQAQCLLDVLTAAQAEPPTIAELVAASGIESSQAHRALGALERAGSVCRISKEFCFAVEALGGLEAAVRSYLHEQGSATVTELKDAMQTSRKYAVPVLEYFDTHGVTRRDGDLRSLRH